ncbi:UNVERIFIED_CONTAM: hypothetical protein H355_014227 [Colinus virginianus]|nr:hypothetical protein H355_014227 [Colinus virginianus]
MHPFGEEEAASLQRLFGFFCECVRSGRWELARACVPQLGRWRGDGPGKVEAILRALVACPAAVRCEQNCSPWRTAWLWLLVLEKWLARNQKTVPVVLRRETEFLLFLEELQKDVSEEVLKELFEAFVCTQSRRAGDMKRGDDCSRRFSLNVVSALRKLLLRAPQRAQALLEFFQEDQGTHSLSLQQYCSLQNICVEFLRDSLKSLQKLQCSSEISELDQRELVDIIYSVLSMVTFEVEHQADELQHLFRELLDVCWAEGSPLREEKLLSCMLRKRSRGLLNLFSSVLIEKTRENLLVSKSLVKGDGINFAEKRRLLRPEQLIEERIQPPQPPLAIAGMDSLSKLGISKNIAMDSSQNSVAPLSNALSQQRNLALFRAFCAMKYAIYALCVNSHKHSKCRDCIRSLLCDASEDTASGEPADCSPVFSQYLVKCHQFLRSVPVPLRLEVLENIFSLLFVSYSDLHSENVLPEDYAEDDDLDKKSSAVSVESSTSRRSSASESPQHLIKAEKKLAARTVHSDTQSLPDLELCGKSCESSKLNYPDLKHFTSSVTGFLVDDVAMDAFLTLLLNHLEEIQSSLPWDSSNVLREELELVECLNLSASRDGFGSRVLQFSKYLSEAHWRYKVVMSNRNADGKEETSSPSWESTSSELSASTSEGSTSNVSGSSDSESRARSQLQNPLIPMMLSPPESLLVSCVLRGNFMEAHQVALMFNLDSSPCYGELVFMERYQEAVREMARVEHNIENQVSDGTGGIRRSSSGRSTLQAIGNAAAAGMVFYSISDVTDKLLATSGSLAPTLQENFWISNIQLEHTDPLWEVLEDLSPSAMAAFDLACTQCRLWKTCKQLLETAERKLYNSLETRELSEEKIGSYFRCSIVDLLQACYPALTEESITNEIILSQNLDQILRALTHVERSVDSKGSLFGTLVEQASLKPVELEKHLVWNQTQLLLRTLDQHFQILPESNVNTNFVKIFFDYVTTLAAVVLRSLNAELDLSAEVKVGNPFILLQQSPSQLLSQLLFERRVQPDRLSSLLTREELSLNVQQVIVNCCCERLSLCNSRQKSQAKCLLKSISNLAHQYANSCLPDVEIPFSHCVMASEDVCAQAPSSMADLSQNALTASCLDFLKSQSKLTATVACLSASNIQKIPKSSLSWMEFWDKRELPLGLEQISRECEALLKEFPILERFLLAMFEPLQNQQEEGGSLAGVLSGKTYIPLVLLGLHSSTAVKVLMEAFEQALAAKDWARALKVLDLYSQDEEELISVKDAVLSCAAAEGRDGWQYLFPVKNATLRSVLALRCLDKWPLDACLEILNYCISELDITDELKADLQSRKKELQVYQKILNLQNEPLWSDWQDLQKACTDDPQAIMNIILKAKDYELCEEWGHLYPVPREDLINLHRDHLLHLLETGDMEKASQLLQRIEDPGICLAISEQSLDQRPSLAASHFLADYLTTHFYRNLTTARRNEIQALYMGSKVLLTLPELSRVNYFHLSSRPLLMVEQLLMNMKVDWVSVAVQTLHQLLGGQEVGFAVEDIDNLLSKYAEKALDFPFSLKERRSDSVIRIQESLCQVLESEPMSKSGSSELSLASFTGVTVSASPRGSLQQNLSQEFVPPEKPPPKQQWIPDDTETICMVCKTERFTMPPWWGILSMRIDHFTVLTSLVMCAVSSCQVNTKEGQDEVEETLNNEYSTVVRIPKTAALEWFLSLNEEENEIVRSEFYYEQAPSSSLCIAILSLHSNSIVCGHQLIEHCCKLSQGLTNPEVDAGLLMDIMKQLLFSAKMMFVKAGRSQDLALCDSYISKVDVLNILVAAAYRPVPSLDQILLPTAVTRLRNRLLEAEYYQLAIEVSTKSGLDPSGAWHAWGMACLKAGNLSSAREKFNRCLKPPVDLNQLNHGSRLVQDVIQYLESTVKPVLIVQDDDYFATLRELEATLRTRSLSLEMMCEGKVQHNSYYQECLFYLHSYGTNLAIISFYMRHDCMREALLHLLNKESPSEVFIEGIFVPSYENGKLHMLENLLETIDPGLESWGMYLIAACKYLQKKNYYHILYELQQFMKVMLEGKNVEEGFGIAFRVLQDFQLEATEVYSKVAKQLVKQQKYSEIRQLLKCVSESGVAAKNDGDTIILNCLSEFKNIPAEDLDNLIQDMDSDENKIQAYLMCNKLRSAYLVSVRQEKSRAVQLVQHVRQLAESSGEDVVHAICTQWLTVHQPKTRNRLGQGSRK